MLEVEVVIRIRNTYPADKRWLNPFARAIGEIQITDALRREQPLVACPGGDVDELRLDVGRDDAECLDCINDE